MMKKSDNEKKPSANTEKSLKELIQDMRIVVQSLREDVNKILKEFENNSTTNQKK